MLAQSDPVTVAGIADFAFGLLAARFGFAFTFRFLMRLFRLALLVGFEFFEPGALLAHVFGLAHLVVGIFARHVLKPLLAWPLGFPAALRF
jgi:hypothetical protein